MSVFINSIMAKNITEIKRKLNDLEKQVKELDRGGRMGLVIVYFDLEDFLKARDLGEQILYCVKKTEYEGASFEVELWAYSFDRKGRAIAYRETYVYPYTDWAERDRALVKAEEKARELAQKAKNHFKNAARGEFMSLL